MRGVVSILLTAGLFALAGTRFIVAQTPERNPLGTLERLQCAFTLTTAADWKAAGPEVQSKSETFSVGFSSIDSDNGEAQMDAAAGAVHVAALLTGSSLHFLERSFQGNLTVTSIFAPADAQGRFRAVRSRHDYLMMNIPGFVASPTVQQRYGYCEVPRP